MKQLRFIHPILLTIINVLFLYEQSWVIASPDQIIRPLLVLVIIQILFAVILRWVNTDLDVISILLTILVLGLFTLKEIFMSVGAILILVVVLYYGITLLLKRKFKVATINILFSVVSLLVLAMVLTPTMTQAHLLFGKNVKHEPNELYLMPINNKPDIYYIVLDGYAREDVLNDIYHFDNSEIINYLKSKGFVIPEDARSNYPKTALSITSALNMEYVQSFAPGLEDQPYWWRMSPFIDDSWVRRSLEKIGYRTVSVATDWGITNNPTTDEYYSPKPIVLTDFEYFLLSKIPLRMIKPWLGKIALVPSYESHRELIQYNFRTLAQMPKKESPKFVFAHIIAPHPPFVFDSDGKPLQPDYSFSFSDANDFPLTHEEYNEGYISQLIYTNGELKNLIDILLNDSVTLPIIIIQADHGPGMLTDFRSSASTCLMERFSIFAAYYLPGAASDVIPDDITPVNIFRLLFNEYFQADMPLLENIIYYYKDNVYIYRTENVTSLVDTCITK